MCTKAILGFIGFLISSMLSFGISIAFTIMVAMYAHQIPACDPIVNTFWTFAVVHTAVSYANSIVRVVHYFVYDVCSVQSSGYKCLYNVTLSLLVILYFASLIGMSVSLWSTPAVKSCSMDFFQFAQVLVIINWSFVAFAVVLVLLIVLLTCCEVIFQTCTTHRQ
jgi:hypothetical protein